MKQYFCSYMALYQGEKVAYGDITFESDNSVKCLRKLTNDTKQAIKDTWFSDRNVSIVLIAFNHVELP